MMRAMMRNSELTGRKVDALGVTVEATYSVGEYDIVILSARDSSGAADLAQPERLQGAARAVGTIARHAPIVASFCSALLSVACYLLARHFGLRVFLGNAVGVRGLEPPAPASRRQWPACAVSTASEFR